jgi:hypothetical protein
MKDFYNAINKMSSLWDFTLKCLLEDEKEAVSKGIIFHTVLA